RLRHGDPSGPVSATAVTTGAPDANRPTTFDVATQAPETGRHILASPDSVHTTIADAAGDTFFGEREAIKLAFAASGSVVAEQSAAHGSLATAQPLGALPGLAVPDTLLSGSNAGKTFVVQAADVVGAIGLDPGTGKSEDDCYSFVGEVGDLFNFQVLSNGLTRTGNPIDSVLRLYDAAGRLLATNDDNFETRDSDLIDFTLPADGVYYLQVDTFTPDGVTDFDQGTYELFVYRFAAVSAGTGLGLGDTLVAGQGNDTLIGSPGNDTFLLRNVTNLATVAGEAGTDLLDRSVAPTNVTVVPLDQIEAIKTVATSPTINSIPDQTVNEGGLLRFTA